MSWLAELVESSEGSLEVLPVQCLCEFLLHDEDTPALEEDPKLGKHKQKQVCLISLSVCLPLVCPAVCLNVSLSVFIYDLFFNQLICV